MDGPGGWLHWETEERWCGSEPCVSVAASCSPGADVGDKRETEVMPLVGCLQHCLPWQPWGEGVGNAWLVIIAQPHFSFFLMGRWKDSFSHSLQLKIQERLYVWTCTHTHTQSSEIKTTSSSGGCSSHLNVRNLSCISSSNLISMDPLLLHISGLRGTCFKRVANFNV